ncbi:hypothetical protein C8F01DRAFT_481152 [Mycena amicta]|nr:hypothetical protein C8F01DRAFT_481152 [Mycena amicta]
MRRAKSALPADAVTARQTRAPTTARALVFFWASLPGDSPAAAVWSGVSSFKLRRCQYDIFLCVFAPASSSGQGRIHPLYLRALRRTPSSPTSIPSWTHSSNAIHDGVAAVMGVPREARNQLGDATLHREQGCSALLFSVGARRSNYIKPASLRFGLYLFPPAGPSLSFLLRPRLAPIRSFNPTRRPRPRPLSTGCTQQRLEVIPCRTMVLLPLRLDAYVGHPTRVYTTTIVDRPRRPGVARHILQGGDVRRCSAGRHRTRREWSRWGRAGAYSKERRRRRRLRLDSSPRLEQVPPTNSFAITSSRRIQRLHRASFQTVLWVVATGTNTTRTCLLPLPPSPLLNSPTTLRWTLLASRLHSMACQVWGTLPTLPSNSASVTSEAELILGWASKHQDRSNLHRPRLHLSSREGTQIRIRIHGPDQAVVVLTIMLLRIPINSYKSNPMLPTLTPTTHSNTPSSHLVVLRYKAVDLYHRRYLSQDSDHTTSPSSRLNNSQPRRSSSRLRSLTNTCSLRTTRAARRSSRLRACFATDAR